MKAILITGAVVAGLFGPFVANEFGARSCAITYDTSLNGLYIVKQRECYGSLGIVISRETVARRERFTRF